MVWACFIKYKIMWNHTNIQNIKVKHATTECYQFDFINGERKAPPPSSSPSSKTKIALSLHKQKVNFRKVELLMDFSFVLFLSRISNDIWNEKSKMKLNNFRLALVWWWNNGRKHKKENLHIPSCRQLNQLNFIFICERSIQNAYHVETNFYFAFYLGDT